MLKSFKNDPYNIVVDTETNKVSFSIGFNDYENLNIMIESVTKKEYVIVNDPRFSRGKLYIPKEVE